ncbi:glycoside hydrolase [Carboxylicivirga linearis]|uniref:Glycoside hydrolase n=1 Tax=Carboxylicivirga linearis TaxID=1628157 RepID=A0ABS5K0F5_9BACT|nr:glycoside hydrolase [Carboxylicivirga linearis]MBS2100565.1 glycoside hydrolase [Carboxylicivirga linearis]
MKQLIIYISLILIGSANIMTAQKRDLTIYEPLRGAWKFSIGDKPEWMSYDYDDSHWESIYVPSPWEQQGFNGYDGYAWYRTSFTLPADATDKELWLDLGYIDDVDECFLNGKLIGKSGSFPPQFKTAYNAHRLYLLKREDLIFGSENILAIRIYDTQSEGGIVSGKIGIWENKYPLIPDVNLSGNWKFKVGDQRNYSDINLDESNWDIIYVPSPWEDQGYDQYDGIAWYRKTITVPDYLTSDSPVLLLGKIDDVDEVYVNGVLIGNTGKVEPYNFGTFDDAYNKLRGYYIPLEILEKSKQITIAVRVYDDRLTGGIYEGPIGLISQDKYIKYWLKQRKEHF